MGYPALCPGVPETKKTKIKKTNKQRIYDQATQILLNEIQMSVKYANIL